MSPVLTSIPSWPWLAERPLVLASGSRTRCDMLAAAGIPVEVVKADIDERAIEHPLLEEGASADAIAAALACAKALAVSMSCPGRFVLGADQTLTCGDTSFHKPSDKVAAATQLAALSGRSHELNSAFVLVRDCEILAEGSQRAVMTMRELGPDFIADYVASPEAGVLESVGSYRLEGTGAQLFTRIEGDHFTILGLPLLPLLAALREQGLLAS